jgi:ParB family chromosome partitioning protein
LGLAELPQAIVLALSEHSSLLTFQMLNAVRSYWEGFGDEKTLDYIPLIEKNGWGYRKVAEDAANAQKGPVKRPRGTKESLAFAGGKGEIKVFDGGRRLEVSLKGITDLEKANAFIEGLKALTTR